jgi:hypothetical protein
MVSDRDADAGRYAHDRIRYGDRTGQGREHAIRDRGDAGLVGHVLQHDRELVSAQPGDGVPAPYAPGQPSCRGYEHQITGRVAEGVVDGF